MSGSKFLDEVKSSPDNGRVIEKRLPPDWQPMVETNGDTAKAVSKGTYESTPNEKELIEGWQLDPDEWQIDGPLNCRRWQTYDERWLYYYKANLVRVKAGAVKADVDELIKLVTKRKPVKLPPATGDGRVLVLSMADFQIGKRELAGGSAETVEYLLASFERIGQRIKELRKVGRPVDEVILANNGDLIEGVTGHYASQTFTVDLNLREQQRVVRHLLYRLIDIIAPLVSKVTVTSVPCNHSEVRNGAGKAFTQPNDSFGHVMIESIEEALSKNEDRYGHINFIYSPIYDLVLDAGGVNLGMCHGHAIHGSGSSGAGVIGKWWSGQIVGNQPLAAADILITAHRHHFEMSEEIGRTIILCPAVDPGSTWYTSSTGRSSPRGVLTVCIGSSYGRGWGDLCMA